MKSERIHLRVTKEEKEKLQKKADAAHLTLTAYILSELLREDKEEDKHTRA